jgi:hypothetical protein
MYFPDISRQDGIAGYDYRALMTLCLVALVAMLLAATSTRAAASPRPPPGPPAACSLAAPCVYVNHDCSGHDIETSGRTKSYTMAACTALCKATAGCNGFVFDAIPAESAGQCKVAKLPAGEACCLLKTACSPSAAAKHGDTAVSFKPAPPPPPPPPPPNPAWCPKYHRIHSKAMCDPSGPIQTVDGSWHVFDDCFWCTADVAPKFPCPWAHWVSTDLLHWAQVPFSVGGCGEITQAELHSMMVLPSQYGLN